VISRDRACLYAQAATSAAPHAVQVADRCHLLHNLTEALMEALAPHHCLLNDTARAAVSAEMAAQQSSEKNHPVVPVTRVRQILWPALQNIYATTKPPSSQLFNSHGATDRSKATSTASSSSYVPCTAVPASIFCASAFSTLHKTRPAADRKN
jgi:hypothetical protein